MARPNPQALPRLPWNAADIPAQDIYELSLEVLRRLEVIEEEMEASLGEIDYLVELAQGGEVLPIDNSDPAGGFGPPDLWVATVVPAVAAVLVGHSQNIDDVHLRDRVRKVVRATKSPRAVAQESQLVSLVMALLPVAAKPLATTP